MISGASPPTPAISDEDYVVGLDVAVDDAPAEVAQAKQPEDERVPFALRLAESSDLPYLVETWKREASRLPIAPAYGERVAYNLTWRARRLLALHGARVACDVEAPGVVLGWACVAGPRVGPPPTPPLVLWIHVRDDFRRQGIAHAMLRDVLELDALVGAQIRNAPPLPARWKYSHFANEWALNP